MGVVRRTTKVEINLGKRSENGANTGKRTYLDLTLAKLNEARRFYVDFYLAHAAKFEEIATYFSEKDQKHKDRKINANELLTWGESLTISTDSHPDISEEWNFGMRFPGMPRDYRRSIINDAIGKARSHICNLKNWEASGKTKGKPGLPGENNHPTLYDGSIKLDLDNLDQRDGFVLIRVFNGSAWEWVNYPVIFSSWQKQRLVDPKWSMLSPKLIIRKKTVGLHIPQEQTVKAKKVTDSKKEPGLVTMGIDLNVKNLAVITVRWKGLIIKTVFVKDQGLDQHRYRHLKVISRHQWQSGKPVKGEHSNAALWAHIQRTNEAFAHKVSRVIADICAEYPGSVLLFERLRKISPKKGESKSRRMNRRKANQLRGKIFTYSKYKAYMAGTVTVEVNPHGTSQYCSHCGHKGERFFILDGRQVKCK